MSKKDDVHVTTAGELIEDLRQFHVDTPIYFYTDAGAVPHIILSVYTTDNNNVAIDIGEY